MKKLNKKGFTLAELLIVVAIIAVLVAIAIPVFSAQLEKSREATDLANIRGAYSELVSDYLSKPTPASATVNVKAKQTMDDWQTDGDKSKTYIGIDMQFSTSNKGAISVPVKKAPNGSYTLKIDVSGKVTVE